MKRNLAVMSRAGVLQIDHTFESSSSVKSILSESIQFKTKQSDRAK
jgi:hypothetical protein